MEFAFLQAAADTANATIYTFSSQNLGTADAARYIIIAIQARGTTAGLTVSSVTIGGVAATISVQRTNSTSNYNVAALVIAAVPTGTTGDVVVTLSVEALRSAIKMYRAVGINSATASDTDSSVATHPTCALDVPAGGFAIGCACVAQGGGAAATTTWTGIAEDSDVVVETNFTTTSASQTFVAAQTGLTLTSTFSAVDGPSPVGVFASWAPSGGANPKGPLGNPFMGPFGGAV